MAKLYYMIVVEKDEIRLNDERELSFPLKKVSSKSNDIKIISRNG